MSRALAFLVISTALGGSAFAQSPREASALTTTGNWRDCVRIHFGSLKESKESAEVIADASFAGCEALESSTRSAWLPLYYPTGYFSLSAQQKIEMAETDTDEAMARMLKNLRTSLLAELIQYRLK